MIPLEDNFADVLGKAMSGLGLCETDVADVSGIPVGDVQRVLAGEFDETTVRGIALSLGLDAGALAHLGRGEYAPVAVTPPWLAAVTSAFHGMTVNAYVVWDLQTRDAAIFDTGTDAKAVLDVVQRENLSVVAIFLTHSHADHIHALDELQRALGVDAWSSELEPVPGTKVFRPGDLFNAGRQFIRTRLTAGHSPGGSTFLIEGEVVKAAVVGDALFAGSIGRVPGDYAAALQAIRREILGLPDATIICPGHGPMTTVALEKANNPFFPSVTSPRVA